ncbi:amidohydrolase family protein [Parahaliea mediterranea]|uniref:PD40 domain-containing protein n=1 Tax=Parahaliea mediterranea TaxID=651086 RepID=A0A939DIC0_9GAMM|nr:amidohydrolase family protein [Parahaliea mediterranea]MBN7798788.1 PD40 domain-containing protein [Parahaliea mediterranea]
MCKKNSLWRVPVRSAAVGLINLFVAGAWGASGDDWDIANTGQPYYDAEFAVDEGTWMSVDVSPDGKTLVFDLLGDIYRMSSSGGEASLVHGGPAIQRMPGFSPDGKRIVYISDESGSDNVWISDVDGGNPLQVSRETVDVMTSPTWSASEDYIIATKKYADFAKVRSSEIRLFHVQGGEGHLLVETPPNQEIVNEADLSDDGRYLFFTEKVSGASIFIDANHKNFVIKRRDMLSGKSETLVEGFGGAVTPQASPDGKNLAFVRRVKDKTVLFVYDLATGEQKPLYDALDRDLQAEFIAQGTYYPQYGWFPDSRHLAIWGKGKIFRVDALTGKAQEIPFTAHSRHRYTRVADFKQDLAPTRVAAKAVKSLAASPHNDWYVLEALGGLWKKAPTGEAVRITESGVRAADPAISPDGRRIAYVRWDDEKGSAIELMDAEGNRVKTVIASRGIIRQPSFSADGKKLVYQVDSGDICVGGFPAKAGLYWVDIRSGKNHFVSAAGETHFKTEAGPRPKFSSDGQRIFYTYVSKDEEASHYGYEARISKLESVSLNGSDVVVHAQAAGTDVSDLTLSPDSRWLAFKAYQQYYVMPYVQSGRPITVSPQAGVSVARISEDGGYGLAWARSSDRVYWLFGDKLVETAVPGTPSSPSRHDGGQVLPGRDIPLEISTPADTPDGVLALTGGRIITMEGDRVIENGTLIVEANRIAAVGEQGDVSIPEGAKVIDVRGKTLMPGLINMHGHIEECYYDTAGITPQKHPAHYASLAFGITTNFDPYASELASYAAAEMRQAGETVAPRLLSSGSVVYGRPGKVDGTYVPVRGYDDAASLMRRKRALGGTIIKSYRQPMRSQRQQLVKAGREAGIAVDAEGESHFYHNLSMVLDGHLNLEHNLPLANYYEDVVQFMAHGGTANTPTLVVTFGEIAGENYMYQTTRAWDDPKVKAYLPKSVSSYSAINPPPAAPFHVRSMTTLHAAEEIWDIGFRAVARATSKLDKAGVTIHAGSHGQVQGLGLHWEMWLLAEGGMTSQRVLRAATINGARTLGVDHQVGSIAVGKLADIVVLDRNPLEDIRHTNSVRYTLLNGRMYDALTMNETGNYDRKRGKFYWETGDYNGIEWNKAWGGK